MKICNVNFKQFVITVFYNSHLIYESSNKATSRSREKNVKMLNEYIVRVENPHIKPSIHFLKAQSWSKKDFNTLFFPFYLPFYCPKLQCFGSVSSLLLRWHWWGMWLFRNNNKYKKKLIVLLLPSDKRI